MLAGRVRRDDGLAAPLGQPVPQLARIVGAVGDQLPRRWYAFKERSHADQIVGLPRRDSESQWPPCVIGYGVNFGRPSAARSADGVFEVPPFAPAAERCALMWVESTAVLPTTPLDPLRA